MATATKKSSKSSSDSSTQKVKGLSGLGLVRVGKELRLELRQMLKMKREEFCRIVNVSPRTIAKVEAAAEEVDKLQRPYNEVYRLASALNEVVDPDSLEHWFTTPNESLGNLKPLEVIERGEIDRLWEIVFRLRSGIPS